MCDYFGTKKETVNEARKYSYSYLQGDADVQGPVGGHELLDEEGVVWAQGLTKASLYNRSKLFESFHEHFSKSKPFWAEVLPELGVQVLNLPQEPCDHVADEACRTVVNSAGNINPRAGHPLVHEGLALLCGLEDQSLQLLDKLPVDASVDMVLKEVKEISKDLLVIQASD